MKRLLALSLAALLCLCTAACSYKDFEDTLHAQQQGQAAAASQPESQDAEENELPQGVPQEKMEQSPPTDFEVRADNVFPMGKQLAYPLLDGKVLYTVRSAKLYDTLAAAGIKTGELHTDDSIEGTSRNNPEGQRFILIELEVENRYTDKDDIQIGSMLQLYIRNPSPDADKFDFREACYQSPHPADVRSTRYFFASFPYGEKKMFKVGWLVQKDVPPANLLFAFYTGRRAYLYVDPKLK